MDIISTAVVASIETDRRPEYEYTEESNCLILL